MGAVGNTELFSLSCQYQVKLEKKSSIIHQNYKIHPHQVYRSGDHNHTVISVGIEEFLLTSFYRMSHDRLIYVAGFFMNWKSCSGFLEE